ncbi:MAG: ATP-binding protein [Bacteroidales bacterium]|nr:ATP-binding protein [Bacteroidales bacterium]
MSKVFVYGMAVKGDNFTDREKETRRLKLNFENGINTILISPRRMGKTSVVQKAITSMQDHPDVITVYMDIYDCRSEYDFYNRFAAAIIQQTATRADQWLENAKTFLSRITPKIAMSGLGPNNEFALYLGLTPETHFPEEILNLPEAISKKRGKQIVVCIDEFQQIGEMPNSLTLQKRMRGVWQHQENCSYCLFGSKKHLMTNLFQNRRMPFYQFGEMIMLDKIPAQDWISYIQNRFESRGKNISIEFCQEICEATDCYSSYVQQLAWNVFAETEEAVDETAFNNGIEALLAQTSALFQQQIAALSTFQMNMLRAILAGHHSKFTSQDIMSQFNLGSKSNIAKLTSSLIEKELIELRPDGLYFADPVFALWFAKDQSAM